LFADRNTEVHGPVEVENDVVHVFRQKLGYSFSQRPSAGMNLVTPDGANSRFAQRRRGLERHRV
jgi:hypothetical protein